MKKLKAKKGQPMKQEPTRLYDVNVCADDEFFGLPLSCSPDQASEFVKRAQAFIREMAHLDRATMLCLDEDKLYLASIPDTYPHPRPLTGSRPPRSEVAMSERSEPQVTAETSSTTATNTIQFVVPSQKLPDGLLNVRVTMSADGAINLVPLDALAQHVLRDIWHLRVSQEYSGGSGPLNDASLTKMTLHQDRRPVLSDDGRPSGGMGISRDEHKACRALIEKMRRKNLRAKR